MKMKRELNSIIADRKVIRHLSKDNSFNTGKNKKLYSNALERNPSNYFLSSYKNTNLKDNNKDINKDNYKNMKKRQYSFKNPKVNSTLNDLYDTINNINHINRKIQKILYSPDTKLILNKAHTINKQNNDTEKTNNDSEKNMIDTHLNVERNKEIRNKMINNLNYKENDRISKSFRRNTNRNIFNKLNPYSYQSRKNYSNGGINSYNNATINDNDNENKYKTLITFRKPEFRTIPKKKSYIKEYKNSSLLRKENTNENENDDNYLSDYESIVSSFYDQTSNNGDNKNFDKINNNKKYYSHFDRGQGRNNDNIKNMKLEINDINRINKLNEEQNQLNYLINILDQNSAFFTTESKINSDISQRTKNFKDIIYLEKYKQIELDKLNYMYDMKTNNENSNSDSNNSISNIKKIRNSHIYNRNNNDTKYESEINNYNYNNNYENKYNNFNDFRENVKYMNYNSNNNNDESSKENNINQFYINLKLNGNNNKNKQFHRNSTNYDFHQYFKMNEDSKIDNDKYIHKLKEKDHTNQHEIYDYRNKKNIFRNGTRNGIRNRNSSLNTDLNNKNKEKIIDNLKNIKFKKYMLENIIPLNNGDRLSNNKKDVIKYSINNYYKSDYNFNYNYSTNSITSRKNMQNKYI